MKIAIIGAGNSGSALGAKLVENGHCVRLVKTSASIHNDHFEAVKKNMGVTYFDSTKDDRKFFAPFDMVTRSVDDALEGVEVVMILTQSLQHKALAKLIGPKLQDGQLVFIIPGNMGSAIFAQNITNKNVILLEGESTPYDARIIEPGVVNILFKNARNAVAFFRKEDECHLHIVDKLFGEHKYLRNNIIESALHNPNLVVHTIGTIMSASRIEQMKGEFWMYRESFSPSVWHLVSALDAEKNSVIEAYGGEALAYLDACKWRNEEDLTKDSLEVFKGYAQHGGPKGPNSLDTRFIFEDVPMGLCLLETLASNKGIATPLTSSLITIASNLNQVDYRSIGYSMTDLTLNN